MAQCLSGIFRAQGSIPTCCAGCKPSILEAEARGSEVQGHLIQLEASLGKTPYRPKKKKKSLKERFFSLTSNFSSVLFLDKPLLERGALDTGVTRPSHSATDHQIHADSKSPSEFSRRGKLNSIVSFFFPLKNTFYSLTVSCVYTMYRDHNTPFFQQSQTQAHVM